MMVDFDGSHDTFQSTIDNQQSKSAIARRVKRSSIAAIDLTSSRH